MPTYTIVTLSVDNGDGSSSCLKFANDEQAQAYADKYDECFDTQVNGENFSTETLIFDENGVLQNPDVWEDF